MELTAVRSQVDRHGNETARLLITVDYDANSGDWQLVSIQTYDCKTAVTTDITYALFNCFHDQAEAMIESIDWKELIPDSGYRSEWNTREPEMNPIFQRALRLFIK